MTGPNLRMQISNPNGPLWQRLQAMDIDVCDARLPYSRRLARDNGWSEAYARRVVDEYRRFLYLAASQPLPVTPSDQVDQAWHLHLLYSRHYWQVLCKDVLRKDLHHGPTQGGAAESSKYREWYERTLELYRQTFAAEPPADIWPPAAARFAHVEGFRRINTETHVVIPRGRAAMLSSVPLAAVLAGCATYFENDKLIAIVLLVLLLVAVLAVIFAATKKERNNQNGGGCAACGGCGGCGGCG